MRKFTLFDMMVLVALVALGIWINNHRSASISSLPSDYLSLKNIKYTYRVTYRIGSVYVILLSILLTIKGLETGQFWTKLTTYPGFLCGILACVAMLLETLFDIAKQFRITPQLFPNDTDYWFTINTRVGYSILSGWVATTCTKNWYFHNSLLERSQIACGIFYIIGLII